MGLFVVLSELDGTGIPLSYLLIGVYPKDVVSKTSDSRTLTLILQNFLQPIKVKGPNPSFLGCDKDRAEIATVRIIWPDAKIQLCYWDAKRAIWNRLKYNRKTKTQNHYFRMKLKL